MNIPPPPIKRIHYNQQTEDLLFFIEMLLKRDLSIREASIIVTLAGYLSDSKKEEKVEENY